MTALDEVDVDRGNDVGMLRRRDLAVVRQGAGFPQQRHAFLALGEIADLGLLREKFQRLLVDGGRGAGQPFDRRIGVDGAPQPSRLE